MSRDVVEQSRLALSRPNGVSTTTRRPNRSGSLVPQSMRGVLFSESDDPLHVAILHSHLNVNMLPRDCDGDDFATFLAELFDYPAGTRFTLSRCKRYRRAAHRPTRERL